MNKCKTLDPVHICYTLAFSADKVFREKKKNHLKFSASNRIFNQPLLRVGLYILCKASSNKYVKHEGED